MATYSYIVLTNSNASLTKRFRVLFEGYKPIKEKVGARRITVTGKVDNQVGPVLNRWEYIIKAYAVTDPNGTDYGLLSDLETFFDYNDPDGTPSNEITLTDHFGNTHTVYMIGVLQPRLQTPVLDDDETHYHVPITLVKKQ